MRYCGNLSDTELRVEEGLKNYIQESKWMKTLGIECRVTPWSVAKGGGIDISHLYTGVRTIIPTWLAHKVGSGVTAFNLLSESAVITSEARLSKVLAHVQENISTSRREAELVDRENGYRNYYMSELKYLARRLGFWPDVAEYYSEFLDNEYNLGTAGYVSVAKSYVKTYMDSTTPQVLPNLQVIVRSSGYEFLDKMNEKFIEIAASKETKSKPGKLTNSMASEYTDFLRNAGVVVKNFRRNVVRLLQDRLRGEGVAPDLSIRYLFANQTHNRSLSLVPTTTWQHAGGRWRNVRTHNNNFFSARLTGRSGNTVWMVNDKKYCLESITTSPSTEFSVGEEFCFPLVLPEDISAEDVADFIQGFTKQPQAGRRVGFCSEPETLCVALAR